MHLVQPIISFSCSRLGGECGTINMFWIPGLQVGWRWGEADCLELGTKVMQGFANHKGRAAIRHYANRPAHPLRPSMWMWNLCEPSFNLRFKLYDCWYYDQMSGCQPQCLMSDEARQGGCRTVASENTEYRSTDGKYRESRRSPSTPLGEAVSVSIISRYILIESGIEALHSRQCHSNWIFFGAK